MKLRLLLLITYCPLFSMSPFFPDDAHSVELIQFKEQFKSHLRELVRHVSETFSPTQAINDIVASLIHIVWAALCLTSGIKYTFFISFKVSIKIKKHTDEAVWIRIAWGDAFTRPNHLKPTYVVHYLHSPYVFVTSLTLKQKPLLSQVSFEG